MSTEGIDYEAVLADLQDRRAKIDAAIEAVKGIVAALGIHPSGSRITGLKDIPSDAFFTMSIADAALKYLGMVKSKQSTEQILEALERGGLPPMKYDSVYTLLRRRANQVGDIVRVGDDWGLAAWYPNNPNFKRRAKPAAAKGQANGQTPDAPTATATGADTKAKPRKGSIGDACERILRKADKPLHITVLVLALAGENIDTNARSLSGNLPQDSKKRFKNLGKNMWALAEWPEEKLARG